MAYSPSEFIRYCLTCSRRRLGNLMLSHMNVEANLKKELAETLDKLIEKIVENRLEARWVTTIRDHGEEIMQALTEKSDERTQPYPPRKIAERAKGTSLPKVLDP